MDWENMKVLNVLSRQSSDCPLGGNDRVVWTSGPEAAKRSSTSGANVA